MSTWVITPTYNERENLPRLLEQLFRLGDLSVVVVDDHSPDGTGRLADDLRSRWPRLHVIHRAGKLGLGTAYQEGWRFALDHGATRLVQLDADLSHPPSLIPRLLDGLTQFDVVVASRYVRGGSMGIRWSRRWISLAGNLYIRALLGWSMHDWSTGFKAWRADLARQVLSAEPTARGYAWLMETTWLARQLGGRVGEVPLIFGERQGGQSKFSWRIALEDLRLAWQLSRRTPPRLAKPPKE